ncbi:hypothetical protein [Streptomyces mirabilis]|uniref:hypothetical protein n=1 Tax=Streptomyces mirabilis TaxID=68239 RepID=UPI0033274FCC
MPLIRLARRRYSQPSPSGEERRDAAPCRHCGRLCIWTVFITLSVLTLVLVATTAHAATTHPIEVLALAQSVNAVLNNIRNWIMGILAGWQPCS